MVSMTFESARDLYNMAFITKDNMDLKVFDNFRLAGIEYKESHRDDAAKRKFMLAICNASSWFI